MRLPWRRAAAALLTVGFAGALGPACPSRDLSVEVSEAGSTEVVIACESFRDACSPTACHHNRFLCNQVTCELRDACAVTGGAAWQPAALMGAEMVLLGATDPLAVEETGACRTLNLRACIPKVEDGCAPITVDSSSCFADAIRAAVTASMGDDLTFSGFHDPSSALLVLALFQAPGAEESCDPSATVTPDVCAPDNLVAAAGFAPPIGGSVYDITCASCQAGELESIGRDTGPCPTAGGACFAERVRDALAAMP